VFVLVRTSVSHQDPVCANDNNLDNSDADNTSPKGDCGVPQRDSTEVVLEFLFNHDYPHKTKQIYAGLIYTKTITFSYRAVQEAVGLLHGEGKIRKVKVDTDSGEVRSATESERGSYVITDAGRTHVDELND
jgi:hypothetical protein